MKKLQATLNKFEAVSSADLLQKCIAYLKDNPNPSDKLVHAWAEKEGFAADEVESAMYKLATAYVQNKLLGLDGKPVETETDK